MTQLYRKKPYLGKHPCLALRRATFLPPASWRVSSGVFYEKGDFSAALPDNLAEKDSKNYSRRLGNALSKRNGVQYTNGLMITKGDVKHHAVTWEVTDTKKVANSPPPNFKGELGEPENTPAHGKKEGNNNNLYRGGTKLNSPKLPLALETGEFTNQSAAHDIPEYPHDYCPVCRGGDYWLTGWNQCLCSPCHPKPEGGDGR